MYWIFWQQISTIDRSVLTETQRLKHKIPGWADWVANPSGDSFCKNK